MAEGKSHATKGSITRRHPPKTASGVGGGCVGTRLDANQGRLWGASALRSVGVRWAVGNLPSAVRFRGIASLHAPRWGRAFAPLRSGANCAPNRARPRPRSARQSLTCPQKVLPPPESLRLTPKNTPLWSY